MKTFKQAGIILLFFISALVTAQNGWKPLLKSQNFKNFKQLNGDAQFKIEKGVLIGISKLNTPNSFLATKKNYADFILEFEVLIEDGLNSGVQFRSISTDSIMKGRVHGYQCEIETSSRKWAGGIYDEARNGWLYPLTRNETGRNAFKKGQWNQYRIEAIGTSIRTWVNDIPCANLIDATTPEGFIAFQVHDIGTHEELEGKSIKWKNIKIKTTQLEKERKAVDLEVAEISYLKNQLTAHEIENNWKLLWDGKSAFDLKGTKDSNFIANGWNTNNGNVSTNSSDATEPAKNNQLLSINQFKDFELSIDFKLNAGADSGISYFVDENKLNTTLEFQLIDDKNHPDAKLGKNGNRTVGSLYDLIRAENTQSSRGKNFKGVGKWNNARIIVKNGHVEHWLNHVKVVEFDINSQVFKALVEKSKFETLKNFGTLSEGFLLLQNKGSEVSFKNIKVRSF